MFLIELGGNAASAPGQQGKMDRADRGVQKQAFWRPAWTPIWIPVVARLPPGQRSQRPGCDGRLQRLAGSTDQSGPRVQLMSAFVSAAIGRLALDAHSSLPRRRSEQIHSRPRGPKRTCTGRMAMVNCPVQPSFLSPISDSPARGNKGQPV